MKLRKDPRYRAPYIDVDEIRGRSSTRMVPKLYFVMYMEDLGNGSEVRVLLPIKNNSKDILWYLESFPGPG